MIFFYLSALESYEDKKQFEELYIKYRKIMYGVAYNILKNKEDAEDAVHQSFIAIANNFKKIKQINCQEVQSYIVIISRNTSINIYHKNKKDLEVNINLDDYQASYDVDFFESFDYDILVSKITELPDIYKDILFLYYMEKFSAKDIASILNISLHNVWKRIQRAKSLLKKSLEEE